ncbi:hypothetical protein [Capybara microvirus Cap3_SP_442]|nr:hypothetical protein [Capybara microvirus Cap3_SP_442]
MSLLAAAAGNIFDRALNIGEGAATSAINSAIGWKYQKKAMNYSDQLQRSFAHDSYGIMRSGLEDAGYNPLLSLSGSSNSEPLVAGASSASGTGSGQGMGNAAAMKQAKAAEELKDSQIDLNASQEALNGTNSAKAQADINNSTAMTKAQVDLAGSQSLLNGMNSAKSQVDMKKLLADIKNNTAITKAQVGLINAQAKAARYGLAGNEYEAMKNKLYSTLAKENPNAFKAMLVGQGATSTAKGIGEALRSFLPKFSVSFGK